MKKEYLILIAIFLLGFLLRIYNLGGVPVSLHRDEAFLGYNAWSILKTGKDMSGAFLPLHFESFLYSPAGYSYFSIPFMAIFGLSPFSIRLASSIFGSFTVIILFFFVKELFRDYKKKDHLALFSSLLLAILPWHINLSRTAIENTIVTFFVLLGIWLYLLWIRKKYIGWLIGAFASFFVTFFIYQAPRAFLPIFIPLFIIAFWDFFKQKKHLVVISILFAITVIFPLLLILHSKNLSVRIRTVSVFASEAPQLILDEQIREEGAAHVPEAFTRIFHNKLQEYLSVVWENYTDHLSYRFFFTDNAFPDRFRINNAGLLYLWELPFLLLGIWFILHYKKQVWIILLGWILITPIGSALTSDDIPNLQRTLIMVPALCIVIAYGYIQLLEVIKQKKIVVFVIGITVVVTLYSSIAYLLQYYVHSVSHRTLYRQEGYEELVNKVNELLPQYKKAIVTNRESAPTIFFLVYGNYDPKKFQAETKNSTMHDFDRINFGHYEFSQEECPLARRDMMHPEKGKILYVESALCGPETSKEARLLETIYRPDHSPVFRIYSFQAKTIPSL